ncbi:MAG: hypothetical protein CMB99_03150 [Flavobacteriaceae bacterium]|nr:hypothetical protein [Flavobacteriaceae bacterium]|tara:strand:+ start:57082 stop:57807 length:726 start_codon:yes stop_codon:yes gene_type:complete
MNKERVKEGIINGYRDFIFDRYQFEAIKEKYDIPVSIDESVLSELRAYYLTHVYPEYSERQALNEAFNSLDKYIQQPQKLIAILFDASKLLFKYGRSLPKILGTGLKALKTFKSASNFENTLVKDALQKKLEGPYDEEKIKVLLKSIPRDEIDAFIETSHALFETLYDRPQVKKIKEIIRYIIAVMKKNSSRYSKDQIKGLEMGFALLDEGDALLQQLPKKDQQRLIDLITEIETDMLNDL